MTRILIAVTLLLAAAVAGAQVNIAATTSNMGMLARTIGGDAVQVRVMAPPDRDAHYLEARPSMMATLRRADLVVAVGAELEVGWLPAATQGAANPRIHPGRPGYFEAAAQVSLIDEGQPADRRLGDVHPTGNPHVYFDPQRFAQVGEALAARLAELDPAHAEAFRARARNFSEQVAARVPQWQERARASNGVLLYHKDADYLTRLLDVEVLGYIEPIPGVPPTARHLRDLVSRLQGRPAGTVAHASFESSRGPRFIQQQLGWDVHALPTNVGLDATAEDYLDLIEAWVEAMSG